MREDFAIFILTHGRPDNVVTAKTIEKAGYTGKWYIVIDDEDKHEDEYRKRYGDKVIQFSKKDVASRTDSADLSEDRRVILFARNACFEIAQDLGLNWFMELDDDYDSIGHRYEGKDDDYRLLQSPVTELDGVIEAMITFLEDTESDTIAMAQGGDFIGGTNSNVWKQGLARKAMNSFIFSAHNPIRFMGRINEDVNLYTRHNNVGHKIFTIADVMINQLPTQSNAGGMADMYMDTGTYVKSFYSVIYSPQAVTVSSMGETSRRLHHRVSWNKTAPKILNEKYRKE